MSFLPKRRSIVGAMLVVFLAWGCETAVEPTIESTGIQLHEEGPSNSLLGGLLGGLGGILNTGVDLVQTTVRVLGDLVGGLIGPLGGVLEVGGHVIAVPEGAVPHPTHFSIQVLPGRLVEVDLRAVDPRTGEDVGGQGFNRPVELGLSYADTNTPRWRADDLVIVRIHDDGTREPLPTRVDTRARRVYADLDHFSRYALCRN